jgi:hypothetical protein
LQGRFFDFVVIEVSSFYNLEQLSDEAALSRDLISVNVRFKVLVVESKSQICFDRGERVFVVRLFVLELSQSNEVHLVSLVDVVATEETGQTQVFDERWFCN